uniref:Twinfilin-1 n=1 Tax=Mesocestoides corti TaxID=53468 RepID=A0A5K3EYS7_MESCO
MMGRSTPNCCVVHFCCVHQIPNCLFTKADSVHAFLLCYNGSYLVLSEFISADSI